MAPRILDNSGPFHLWDRPAAYPQADLVNGVNEKPVFDLGVDLDHKEGVAYIQADHVVSMARSLGMVTKEEHEKALGELKNIKESTPESELERLSNVIGNLDSFVRDNLAVPVHGSGVPVESTEQTESASNADSGDSEDVNQPALFKRSDELSSPTGNDGFGFDSLDSATR